MMLKTLEERVDIRHTALLVVDLQNDYCHRDGAFGKIGINLSMFEKILPNVNQLIHAAREVEVPVIFIRTVHSQWTNSGAWVQRFGGKGEGSPPPFCVPGTWGADWYGVAIEEKDYVVTKHRYSGFVGTDLNLVLRSLNRKTIVVTGGETNVCVGSTARDGLMHDYYVVLPEDCIAGFDEQLHQYGLEILGRYFGILTTLEEVTRIWRR